jgi:hypothetical protein
MPNSTDRQDPIRTLREAGILNPKRVIILIRRTIEQVQLDLSGLTVLTEAASGAYVCTPVIAAMARAEHVFAVTGDSQYASADTVVSLTRALGRLCDIPNKVEISTKRRLDLFAQADIVTNLGFVRPIDAEAVSVLKPTAVISLMCETWEYRPGDVDLNSCRQKGIQVLGTNEDFKGLEVFRYSGVLCAKMILDAQIEIYKSKIIVVSTDKFGKTITEYLKKSGAKVELFSRIPNPEALHAADALVIADYTRSDEILGRRGDVTAAQVAKAAPGITVVRFAGRIDVQGLREQSIPVYPDVELGPHRMAMTLAALGPRPVVELHAAGLKVGEMMARTRLQGLNAECSEQNVLGATSLAQGFGE